MTAAELPEELVLIGYEALTPEGFALPLFGTARGANTWWTAEETVPGDPSARIRRFWPYRAERPLGLSADLPDRVARVGEAMPHVFLWRGKPWIGTGRELWSALGSQCAEMAEKAPMSLVALAEQSGQDPHHFARIAAAWWRTRFGDSAAEAWLIDSYLRNLAIRHIRLALGADVSPQVLRDFLRQLRVIKASTGVQIAVPFSVLELLPDGFASEELTDAAKCLDLGRVWLGALRPRADEIMQTPQVGQQAMARLAAMFQRLLERGEELRREGNRDGAHDWLIQALAIADSLVVVESAPAEWQRALSVSLNNVGDMLFVLGDLNAALASYEESRAIAARFVAANPNNVEWQRDLCVSLIKVGDIQRNRSDVAAALASYEASRAIAARLAAANPGNTEWQRDLSVSLGKVGDVQRDQGDLAAAFNSYEASRAIRERLAATDPANTRWQRDLSVSLDRIGDVQVDQGALAAALASYEASRAIFERIAATDIANTRWQRDVSVSLIKVGGVHLAKGELAAALAHFQASRAIAERLAATDPTNAEWQRDLSVSLIRVGEVQRKQGDVTAALASYEASRAIAARLSSADPANTTWQRDLSISLDRIGEVQAEQGEFAAALANCEASLAIFERLAAADPAHAGWQYDLAATHARIGDILALAGRRSEALASFETARAIYAAALERNAGDVQARLPLVIPLLGIGRLRGAEGRAELEAALAILRPLAAADRLDDRQRGWIAEIEEDLARIRAWCGRG